MPINKDKNTVEEFDINQTLTLLGLKPTAQKVFRLLIQTQPSPASAIAKSLQIPKSTVYDALHELSESSLVIEYNEETKKSFGAANAEQLLNLHKEKISQLKTSEDLLARYLPNLMSSNSLLQPKIKFYSGKDGIRHAFNDTPWVPTCTISHLMWPMQDMIDAVGMDFLKFHGEKRFRHKVFLKVVQKDSDRKIDREKHAWLKSDPEELLSDIRYAPKHIKWGMSFWVYDDKCLLATGDKERFAFIVYSKEFADLMRTLWEQMWNISTP